MSAELRSLAFVCPAASTMKSCMKSWTLLGVALLATCGLGVAPAVAGEYNPTLSIGDPAPAWGGLPGTDGKTHALADRRAMKVVVIAFTCNSCPYARDVEDRLGSLAKTYAEQDVAVVTVNCNAGESETLDQITARAEAEEFPYASLKDEAGLSADAFGATRTPEFFVIDGDHKIVYMGAFDSNPEGKPNPDKATKTYVEDAVRAVLAGEKPAVTQTPPIGCLIKRPRRGDAVGR